MRFRLPLIPVLAVVGVVLLGLAVPMLLPTIAALQPSAAPAAERTADGHQAGSGNTTAPDALVPRPASPAGKAAPVVLAPVGTSDDGVTIEATGTGQARRSSTLRPAAAGEVVAVNFRAGQAVRTGQVLLRLDDRTQRLAVDAAANQLDAAQRLLARYESIPDASVVPGSVLDESRAAVRTARIALEQARAALADRVVLAPFDGVTGLARVQPGDRVATDTVVTTLDDRRALRVGFSIPELYLARLRVGQPVELLHHAYPERVFAGRVTQIDSQVDAATRNLHLEAEVPNPSDLLRPGMSFQVRLKLAGVQRPTVPELALQYDREAAFVWASRDGHARRVTVQALQRRDGQVLVSGELRPGELVVVQGAAKLREGQPLQGVTAPGAAATTGQAIAEQGATPAAGAPGSKP